jgi:hypothetical protein
MGKKRKPSAAPSSNGTSAGDIMTSLIGCLIFILLGIMIMVLVSQVLVAVADPDGKQVISVVESHVDGFRESEAFPEGNIFKEPLYVDVHPDKVVVYPYDAEFSQRSIIFETTDYDTMLEVVASRPDKEYVLFLVRPQASRVYNLLRRRIEAFNRTLRDPSTHIEMGMELYESDRKVDAGMTTRQREGFQEWDLQEFRKQRELEAESKRQAEAAALPAPTPEPPAGGG